ncbi:hypothetical protein [Nitrososphaera sp.]
MIGGSPAAAWYAKKKFQPEIERSLEKQERSAVEVQESVHKKRKEHH